MENQRDFAFQHKGYEMAGFTVPQKSMTSAFDREQEDILVKACSEKIAEVFGDPNKFEKRLAKSEGIPIDNPDTKSLHNNIIYTDDPEYYCRGSGGIGGGKVFWTPYTTKDDEKRKKIIGDDLCDNCKTLAHESQHGIGSNAEFDGFSSLPSILFRLENFDKGNRLEHFISSTLYSIMAGCKEEFKKGYQKRSRNQFCAINERKPDLLKEVLLQDGFSEELIDEMLKCACGKKQIEEGK